MTSDKQALRVFSTKAISTMTTKKKPYASHSLARQPKPKIAVVKEIHTALSENLPTFEDRGLVSFVT